MTGCSAVESTAQLAAVMLGQQEQQRESSAVNSQSLEMLDSLATVCFITAEQNDIDIVCEQCFPPS